MRFLIWLRYRVEVKGRENLTKENLSKSGGILFLANHPAEIDPLILLSILWFPFKLHPVAIDYLFRKPIIGSLLHFVGAISVPNFDISSNSYKRKQMQAMYARIFSYLAKKENLLIYPAGGLKNGPEEVIGGASGVHAILEAMPETNVVLVRSTGWWGSSFSRAPTGKTPDLLKTFLNGFKVLIRNCIFFAPRRKIVVDLEPAPPDFPWKTSRREFNRYLENWYNAPGLEPLNLVSFSHFRKHYPLIKERVVQEKISLDQISDPTKQRVFDEIATLSRIPKESIHVEDHLAQELGLDSLDVAQLVAMLKEEFGIHTIHSTDLTTVGSVLAYASKQKKSNDVMDEPEKTAAWPEEKNRPLCHYPNGKTIPEIFFTTAKQMNGYIACADNLAGTLSYRQLKLGILLLADAIKKLPGVRVGIMMPASVAVNAMILATILAGKIPVMINWTLGMRNLESIVAQSQITVALSSWQFIDRLDNVELGSLDEKIVLLEDIRSNFSIIDKLKALYLSFLDTKRLFKKLGIDRLQEEDTAAILFTSGTESYPKGVPLSHKNLISNQQGAYQLAQVNSTDILLGALPPFHSFGFSVTGLLPLLAGLRVAYSPNPTDGRRIAEAVARWRVTLLCLAPTFLKNLLRVASVKQLASLRLVVSGAEKAAGELFDKLKELNPAAQLIEGYGITECAPILTINPPNQPIQGVGQPLQGVEILIVDPETYQPLPIAERGLILARGPNIFKGYLDFALTSPFVEVGGKQWYLTGDLGYLDKRNYLTLSGRLKRFVKIGGEMVSLTAIEEALYQAASRLHWKLDEQLPSFAVCALESEGKKSEMHLFTVIDTTVDEVNQILRENKMSNIIKIRSVKKVAFIPMLGTGKIDYRKLLTTLV